MLEEVHADTSSFNDFVGTICINKFSENFRRTTSNILGKKMCRLQAPCLCVSAILLTRVVRHHSNAKAVEQ